MSFTFNPFTGTLDNVGSGSSGANTTLSNLTSPTSINQDLNFNASGTIDIGSINSLRFIRAVRHLGAVNVVSTGDISSGTNTILNTTNATQLTTSHEVSNANFPAGTLITAIVGTTVTVSANATGSAIGASITFVGTPTFRGDDQVGAINSAVGTFRTGQVVNGISGGAAFRTGDASGTGNSGGWAGRSGNVISGTSGTLSHRSGTSTTGNTGSAGYGTGNSTAGGNTGVTDLASGSVTTGTSGVVLTRSGNASSAGGSTGAVGTGSGNVTTGTSGATSITTGAASGAGTTGDILITTGTTVGGIRGSTKMASDHIEITASGGTPQQFRFMDADNSAYIGLAAPSVVAASTLFILPDADGTAGYVLSTNGTGVLSFIPPGAPTSTANTVAYFNGSGNLDSNNDFYYDPTINTLAIAPGITLSGNESESLFIGLSLDATAGTTTNSIVVGFDLTVNSGVANSIIMGNTFSTSSSIDNSLITGRSHQSSGSLIDSIVGGFNNTWAGSGGTFLMVGNSNIATGVANALISGFGNDVSAQDGLTAGDFQVVTHHRTLLAGQGHETTLEAQTLVGQFSDPTVTTMFAIGVGADDSNRANAFSVDANGDINIENQPRILEGSNKAMGISTLVAGTVTVSNTLVTANTRIMLTGQNSSGTHGELTISARNAGTDFTITSLSALDTRNIAWILFEPN